MWACRLGLSADLARWRVAEGEEEEDGDGRTGPSLDGYLGTWAGGQEEQTAVCEGSELHYAYVRPRTRIRAP